jgi:hypothetical protein
MEVNSRIHFATEAGECLAFKEFAGFCDAHHIGGTRRSLPSRAPQHSWDPTAKIDRLVFDEVIGKRCAYRPGVAVCVKVTPKLAD